MNPNLGIFENHSNPTITRDDSAFSAVMETMAPHPRTDSFATHGQVDSSFTASNEPNKAPLSESNEWARLTELLKIDSPLDAGEPTEGFEPRFPQASFAANPFEASPAVSPFAARPQSQTPSPLTEELAAARDPEIEAAIAALTQSQQPDFKANPSPASPFVAASPAVFGGATVLTPPVSTEPTPQPKELPPQVSSPFVPTTPEPFYTKPQAPAAEPTHTQTPSFSENSFSDSFSIRQLELRAIFGVDREMNSEEMIKRSLALPGIRDIARVNLQDMTAIETLKNLIATLGFGNGHLKLYSGSSPLEFIREGAVMLAIQTDDGFAPGVRETLMIVARELNRIEQ